MNIAKLGWGGGIIAAAVIALGVMAATGKPLLAPKTGVDCTATDCSRTSETGANVLGSSHRAIEELRLLPHFATLDQRTVVNLLNGGRVTALDADTLQLTFGPDKMVANPFIGIRGDRIAQYVELMRAQASLYQSAIADASSRESRRVER